MRVGQRLSGYNRPQYRRRGLAGLGDPVFTMTNTQVNQFLARHPGTKAIVDRFKGEVQTFGYYQGATGYSIPEWGMAVHDDTFGNVIVFPDADGDLRYTGSVSATVAAQTNKPPYEPPPHENPLSSWEKVIEYAPYVLAAGAGLWLLTLLPRPRG